MDSSQVEPIFENLGRERAAEQVVGRLRDAITSGRLRPGDRLMQDELARHLGVSRMPVREALRRLEAEGLVVLQPYRGALVAELSAQELREIYEIRIALETLALRVGVPMMGPDRLRTMEGVLRRLDDELDGGAWVALNAEFHSLLYEACERDLLLETIQNLRNKSDRYLRLFAARRDRTAQAQEEHWAIFDACRRGEAEEAESLLARHLKSTIVSLSATLGQQGAPGGDRADSDEASEAGDAPSASSSGERT